MINDFESIYLGPKCEAESDGRTWAHHDAWEPCECGEKPVRYVRADIHDALKARLAEAENRSCCCVLAARLAAMERGGVCIWCGEAIDLTGKSMEAAVGWARQHDADCPDNPLRARLAVMETALCEIANADGMYVNREYRTIAKEALKRAAASAEDGTNHHPNCTPPCGICEPDEWEKQFLASGVDPVDGI